MIYLETASGHRLIILEPINLQHLAKGGVAKSPDDKTAVMYTPDAVWMAQQMAAAGEQAGGITPDDIDRIHTEGMRRVPVVVQVQEREHVQVIHQGKPVAKA